jgi:hypothetical protein
MRADEQQVHVGAYIRAVRRRRSRVTCRRAGPAHYSTDLRSDLWHEYHVGHNLPFHLKVA